MSTLIDINTVLGMTLNYLDELTPLSRASTFLPSPACSTLTTLPHIITCWIEEGRQAKDNAPPHKSDVMREWFHNHGITLLDFPPYSPDLNPIENVWAHLKRRVEKHRPRTADELEAAIREEWEAVDNSFLLSLAHSMPARLQAVIDNRGGKTHY